MDPSLTLSRFPVDAWDERFGRYVDLDRPLQQGRFHAGGIANSGLVVMHPFVLGELACGNLRDRENLLNLLSGLSFVRKAHDDELLHFISRHQLNGIGLGLVDMHLLASCLLDPVRLWTRDKRLRGAAMAMGTVILQE